MEFKEFLFNESVDVFSNLGKNIKKELEKRYNIAGYNYDVKKIGDEFRFELEAFVHTENKAGDKLLKVKNDLKHFFEEKAKVIHIECEKKGYTPITTGKHKPFIELEYQYDEYEEHQPNGYEVVFYVSWKN